MTTAGPLTELEIDALTELVNIGVSRAAVSLREMVKQEVLLSVPRIELVGRARAIQILCESEARKLVAVHQTFVGDITGRALLIFPETKSLEIVRAVAGQNLSLEDVIDLEQEALAETGNIILNGCLATIANMLQRSLKMSLPEVLYGEAEHFFSLPPPPEGGHLVLFVYINFALQERDIRGYIAMLMDMPSLSALKALLADFITRTTGETSGLMPASDTPDLQAIFGALDIGVILIDEKRSVITWNDWLERASGVLASNAAGRMLSELFPQSKTVRLETAIAAALESGVSSVLTHSLHRMVFPLRTAAGQDLIHDVSIRPLGDKGSRTCLLQIDDVTVAVSREHLLRQRHEARYRELKAIEDQLRQSQKMEAVGQLTGGIAHDFNNLLQGIIGSLDRVQYRIGQGRINDVDRFLKGASESASRAAALTHRLLAFSRRQPVAPKAINPNELIASVEELIRRSIGENITFQMNLAPASWLVRCDTNQLENALLNLSINARDAMPDGGTLLIETANVILNDQGALARDVVAGEYVSIKVSDTGVGMPDDVKAQAFNPFFTTKPIGQGTGLGLSMIYGFVRQSDGGIVIESAPGRGTEIELCLPRFAGEVSAQIGESLSVESRTDHGEIVLVVEDEPVVRHLVVETLGDLGYRALEAANGDAALRILQSPQRIDLLITDIGLPGLNGRQLADAARTQRPGLKTLFMTGYAETAASSNFLQPGMEMITKPFQMDVLAKRIQGMLGISASHKRVSG